MDAKLKAKELVEKFKEYAYQGMGLSKVESITYNAKQCALICCDEILDRLFNVRQLEQDVMADEYTYWQEVKQHINEL